MGGEKSTDIVAGAPRQTHSDLAVFSGGPELFEDQDPVFRWPIIMGGNAFEVITSLSKPSPVAFQVTLHRYTPSNPTAGQSVHTYTVAAGAWVDYETINVDFERGQQISPSVHLLDDLGDDEPGEGLLIVVRVAA